MVTDVIMPGMTGRELADRLLEKRPGMRVLFVSGYTDNIIAERGMLAPGTAFLQKPFSPRHLAAKVREVLDEALKSHSGM
jgi:FixJ family two-component response regulator